MVSSTVIAVSVTKISGGDCAAIGQSLNSWGSVALVCIDTAAGCQRPLAHP